MDRNYYNFFGSGIPKTSNMGQSGQWSLFDSEENYNQRGNKNINPMSVSYQFNSHGYRCDDFDETTLGQPLFIGCSFTLGEGVSYEDVWARKMFRWMQKKDPNNCSTYINLSMNGGSWDYVTRTLVQIVPVIKPSVVIAYLPAMYRQEIINGRPPEAHPFNWVPGLDHTDAVHKAIAMSAMHEEIVLYRLLMNIRTIESVCRLSNCELLWSCWDRDMEEKIDVSVRSLYGTYFRVMLPKFMGTDQAARDGVHPGKVAHEMIFDQFRTAYLENLK